MKQIQEKQQGQSSKHSGRTKTKQDSKMKVPRKLDRERDSALLFLPWWTFRLSFLSYIYRLWRRRERAWRGKIKQWYVQLWPLQL